MPEPPQSSPVDLEWHEQVLRRLASARPRSLRVRDLAGAVLVSAVILGLARFSWETIGAPSVPAFSLWLASTAGIGVVAILGLIAAAGLGRASTALYGRGKGPAGMARSVAIAASILADLLAFGILMATAIGATLYLVMSALFLMGGFS